jgi:thiol:disulfide interchange protein DsbD
LRVFDPLPDSASGWKRMWKGVGVLLVLAGTVQVVGVATGGRDVLQPLQQLAVRNAGASALASASAQEGQTWRKIKSVAELDAAIATSGGRPVMLDFYADWCVSCVELERFTFSDGRVAGRMQQFLLLKADVTKNTEDDKAMLKRFNLFGPPGIVFFGAQGRELRDSRVIGFQNAATFLATLDRVIGTVDAPGLAQTDGPAATLCLNSQASAASTSSC